MPVYPSRNSSNTTDKNDFQPIEFIDSEEFGELEFSKEEVALIRQMISADLSSEEVREPSELLGVLMSQCKPLLSPDEERMLFRRMNYLKFQAEAIQSTMSLPRPSKRKQEKIDALLEEAAIVKRRILESNLRLVASLARKFVNSSIDADQLVSDGLFVLLGAITKFDYSRGFRFSTYATHAIQRHYFRLSKRGQRYLQRFVLTPGDVLAEVGSYSEEEPIFEENSTAVYVKLMNSAKGRLTDREETILHRRFGTGGVGVTQTLREVATDLGISKERVRQVQITALNKLREIAIESKLMTASDVT
ncbi:MAG: sigma-70 family RNA polymerase sigma factor [Planctomycetaceae bacterium]|nr:sigma-70 family RNA polymerase sigma factor [Planctomycetaceae bacterium]